MPSPFDTPQQLHDAFVDGLQKMLDAPGLGSWILVLANAAFDPRIFDRLHDPLRQRFDTHADRIRAAFTEGHEVDEAPDDLLVFLKLMALGFDRISTTEIRRSGDWELQFNLLRAFRPKRISGSVVSGIQLPYNPDAFHFNKPFLRRETFWSGVLAGRDVDLLYNKFPFADLHGLLVPDRESCLPQFLTERYHHYAWQLSQQLGQTLPGIGCAYNSYGAFASVNHLHFQLFLRQQPLPVMEPHWHHNGGQDPYPTDCIAFEQPGPAWDFLQQLHQRERAYNLLYLPGRLLCLPRARQGNYQHAEWTAGFAWYEMCGGAVAFNRTDYQSLDDATIAGELRLVKVPD